MSFSKNNSIDELLAVLDIKGIRVRVDGLDLKVKWPGDIVPEIRQILKAKKPEIIQALTDIDRAGLLLRLTPTEREAYEGWYEIMISDRFKMTPEEAHTEARKLLQRSIHSLRIKQAEKDLAKSGFVRIHSTKLGRDIYLCRDDEAIKRVPDNSIPIIRLVEIEELKNLKPEEALFLLEAKILFGGTI